MESDRTPIPQLKFRLRLRMLISQNSGLHKLNKIIGAGMYKKILNNISQKSISHFKRSLSWRKTALSKVSTAWQFKSHFMGAFSFSTTHGSLLFVFLPLWLFLASLLFIQIIVTKLYSKYISISPGYFLLITSGQYSSDLVKFGGYFPGIHQIRLIQIGHFHSHNENVRKRFFYSSRFVHDHKAEWLKYHSQLFPPWNPWKRMSKESCKFSSKFNH